MIELSGLKKEYLEQDVPTQALRGVDLTIKKGEFVSIMGPSGSGKSTLLHILSFLDRPTGGTYTFLGKSIDEMDKVESQFNEMIGSDEDDSNGFTDASDADDIFG